MFQHNQIYWYKGQPVRYRKYDKTGDVDLFFTLGNCLVHVENLDEIRTKGY